MNTQLNTSLQGRRANGFTLIELMITIAVVGILAAIALPSYNNYVLESGRADAKAALYGVSQTLERCFTRYGAYDNAACPLAQGDTEMSENDKYQITVTTTTPNTFALTAAPQGPQTKDTECGNFTLSHTGAKGVSGSGDVEECW